MYIHLHCLPVCVRPKNARVGDIALSGNGEGRAREKSENEDAGRVRFFQLPEEGLAIFFVSVGGEPSVSNCAKRKPTLGRRGGGQGVG